MHCQLSLNFVPSMVTIRGQKKTLKKYKALPWLPVRITKLLHFMFRALHELLPNFTLDSLPSTHTPCSYTRSLLFLEQALLWLILWPLPEMSLFPFSYCLTPFSQGSDVPSGEAFPDVPQGFLSRPGFRLQF